LTQKSSAPLKAIIEVI